MKIIWKIRWQPCDWWYDEEWNYFFLLPRDLYGPTHFKQISLRFFGSEKNRLCRPIRPTPLPQPSPLPIVNRDASSRPISRVQMPGLKTAGYRPHPWVLHLHWLMVVEEEKGEVVEIDQLGPQQQDWKAGKTGLEVAKVSGFEVKQYYGIEP